MSTPKQKKYKLHSASYVCYKQQINLDCVTKVMQYMVHMLMRMAV
jgi:hypothetical protein